MTPADPELDAIRSGDERAYEELTRRHYPAMLRLAMNYVRDREAADDVIQETWATFLQSLDRFEGRSTVRTWLFGILTNVARARRRSEARWVTFTSLLGMGMGSRGPTVDPKRFGEDGRWRTPPNSWTKLPDAVVESKEMLGQLMIAIDRLPPKLREVVWLRDVVGLSADEVSRTLRISDSNQRVRLHRARAAVRQTLEDYLR